MGYLLLSSHDVTPTNILYHRSQISTLWNIKAKFILFLWHQVELLKIVAKLLSLNDTYTWTHTPSVYIAVVLLGNVFLFAEVWQQEPEDFINGPGNDVSLRSGATFAAVINIEKKTKPVGQAVSLSVATRGFTVLFCTNSVTRKCMIKTSAEILWQLPGLHFAEVRRHFGPWRNIQHVESTAVPAGEWALWLAVQAACAEEIRTLWD